jgi:two-component system response regulator LytT
LIDVFIISSNHKRVLFLADSIGGCLNSCSITTTTVVDDGIDLIFNNSVSYDIFIIDIDLDTISGYVLEKKIRTIRRYRNTPVIFVTQHSYSLMGVSGLSTYQVYKLRNYISLPLDRIDIQSKIGLYLEAIEDSKKERTSRKKEIEIKTSNGIKRFSLKDIIFLEIQNKECSIHTVHETFTIKRTSLVKVLDLFNSPHIIRCHRFYGINTNQISYIEKVKGRWTAHFVSSDLVCPISEKYYDILYKNGI